MITTVTNINFKSILPHVLNVIIAHPSQRPNQYCVVYDIIFTSVFVCHHYVMAIVTISVDLRYVCIHITCIHVCFSGAGVAVWYICKNDIWIHSCKGKFNAFHWKLILTFETEEFQREVTSDTMPLYMTVYPDYDMLKWYTLEFMNK